MINEKKIFKVSITGNRDISTSKVNFIYKKIKKILEEIIENNPSKEIFIITPLADGVDRIIADIVLDNDIFKSFEFLIPLPMSENIYLKTFGKGLKINNITAKKSADEYFKLKNKIEDFNKKEESILNLPFDDKLYLSSSEDNQRMIRRKQYEILGDYLIENSDVLIAVYEENREVKQGSTLEIINKFNNLKKDEKKLFTIKL